MAASSSKTKFTAEEARSILSSWLDDSCDESESEFESSTSSSESGDGNENVADPVVNIVLPDNVGSTNLPQQDNEEDTNHDLDNIPNGHQKKRGRKPTLKSKPNKKVRTLDTWDLITDKVDDKSDTNFRFCPTYQPGVITDQLDHESTPIDCFFQLFDIGIQEQLINMINAFADRKVQMNTPANKGSMFSSWVPIDRHELMKFLAVLIGMGLDKRPTIKDYWSNRENLKTPWYSAMFSRNRFEAIFHTMLHVSNIEEEHSSTNKIDPFYEPACKKIPRSFLSIHGFIDRRDGNPI